MKATSGGTALVTGVSGFVGSHVARIILERGREVRALVRPGSDVGELAGHPGLEVVAGDLADEGAVRRAARGCREVYHVAADYRFWSKDPRELYESNERGTENVMRAAGEAGAERIVHTSTVGTIGLAEQPKACREDSPRAKGQFNSHYKKSKLAAERVALEHARQGLPVVVVNPSTPIGAGDRKPTPTGRIILDFVQGKMPAYVRTGLNFAPVRDIAEGHLLAAEKGRVGERYILGGENLDLADFLGRVARQCRQLGLAGAPMKAPSLRIPYAVAWLSGCLSTGYADLVSGRPPAVPLEAVRMSKRFMFFDTSKAERELGVPSTPLDAAIAEALEWFFHRGYFNDEIRKTGGESHARAD